MERRACEPWCRGIPTFVHLHPKLLPNALDSDGILALPTSHAGRVGQPYLVAALHRLKGAL